MSPASTDNPGIPPSSLMSFLRVKPSVSGVVLTEFDRAISDPYAGSRFDNGSRVDAGSIAAAAAVVAGAVQRLAGGAGMQLEVSSFVPSTPAQINFGFNKLLDCCWTVLRAVLFAGAVKSNRLILPCGPPQITPPPALPQTCQINASRAEDLAASFVSCLAMPDPGLSCPEAAALMEAGYTEVGGVRSYAAKHYLGVLQVGPCSKGRPRTRRPGAQAGGIGADVACAGCGCTILSKTRAAGAGRQLSTTLSSLSSLRPSRTPPHHHRRATAAVPPPGPPKPLLPRRHGALHMERAGGGNGGGRAARRRVQPGEEQMPRGTGGGCASRLLLVRRA